ncbi:unnamed protein product [Candida verbasci]|uniref:BAG domain-containing protein n=1 Tax=Candida verbasci TaxID=1227364 RepID=A0A9W4XFN6_9ASCO|nr:unnamed protein product [Candida verbasci]
MNFDQFKIPSTIEEAKYLIFNHIKTFKKENIIHDFKNFKISPITITISLITLFTILIFGKILTPTSTSTSPSTYNETEKTGKKTGGKKKLSKAQRANKEIQQILDFVESEYVPEIDSYIENYKSLSKEDVEYKFSYFEEMLLKELMKLDEIDVTSNEILRENRRKVIKFVQDHQKRLDKFKKDIS